MAKRLDGSRNLAQTYASASATLCWMGTPLSVTQRDTAPPIFGLCLLWPNAWMDQDVTWYVGRPRSRPHCVRWGPSSLPKKGTASSFRPMSIVAIWSPISTTAEHLLLQLWSPCVIVQTIIFLPFDFYLLPSFFFPRIVSAFGDWMSNILPHMVYVALVRI